MSSGRSRTRSRHGQIILGSIAVLALVAIIGGALWYDKSISDDSPGSPPTFAVDDGEGAPATPLTVQWPDNDPLAVTVIGDSLTYGYNATDKPETYLAKFTDTLEEVGPVDIELTATPSARIADFKYAPIDPASRLVVMEIGTSDLGPGPTPIAIAEAQYRDLLDRVRDEAPDAQLVCLGTWFEASGGFKLNTSIATQCRMRGGYYVDLAAIYQTPVNRGPADQRAIGLDGISDDFHPNNSGHAAIAQRLNSALKLKPAQSS